MSAYCQLVDCVTDIVLVIPPPETVIVPLLEETSVFAVAFIVKLPLFEPLAGDTVSHDVASLETVQGVLEVTETILLDAAADGNHVVWLTARLACASCVTDIVLVIPPPETVTVPLLGEALVFAAALIVKLKLLDPLVRDTVSHVAALLEAETVHETLDVTDTLVFAADADGDQDVGLTVRFGAACVTDIVRLSPPPETVTVPLLDVALVFAAAVIVKLPLFEPLDGDTVSHVAALLEAETVHETLDVTDTVVFAADADGDHDVGLTVRIGAACVTDIVLVNPPPETVTVPLLEAAPVFAAALIVKLPLLEPLDGDTVSHDVELLETVHETLDVTDTVVFDADAGGVHDVGLTVRLASPTANV